jgi:hypothetical protein
MPAPAPEPTLRAQLTRATRERDQAVQIAVLLQTRGGRARRNLAPDEALGIVLEWLSDPALPVGSLVTQAMAAHDRRAMGLPPGPGPATRA